MIAIAAISVVRCPPALRGAVPESAQTSMATRSTRRAWPWALGARCTFISYSPMRDQSPPTRRTASSISRCNASKSSGWPGCASAARWCPSAPAPASTSLVRPRCRPARSRCAGCPVGPAAGPAAGHHSDPGTGAARRHTHRAPRR